MLAAVRLVIADAAGWVALIGALATGVATAGKVWRTCVKVAQWMIRNDARFDAIDVLSADWRERGITPEGAVREGQKYRDLVDVHTAALSEHKTRIDDHEDRIVRLERS